MRAGDNDNDLHRHHNIHKADHHDLYRHHNVHVANHDDHHLHRHHNIYVSDHDDHYPHHNIHKVDHDDGHNLGNVNSDHDVFGIQSELQWWGCGEHEHEQH